MCYRGGLLLVCLLLVLGWGKADDVVCLHLGIRRSWLIVVSIILGVSFMVILRGFM